MRDFIYSGRAIDLVLAVMVVEFCLLLAFRARGNVKRKAVELFFALMPGAILLLALRAALVGANWSWIALLIALSFPFHLADLARRR